MKKLLLYSCILLFSLPVVAQQIDQTRMDRDLEVAKNVLQTLFNQDRNMMFWGRNIEAVYLEGYGVIFTLPDNFSYLSIKMPKMPKMTVFEGEEGYKEEVIVVDVNVDEDNSIDHAKMEEQKEAVITFLADYSDLIGQLKPDEKIKVHNRANDNVFYVGTGRHSSWSMTSSGLEKFSAEVKKKDVTAYKEGKISRKELVNRITFTTSEPVEIHQDLELFAIIVKRLYSPDLSETYFTNRTPHYELLKDYGVIFYLKTYSSYSNNDLYRMPVLGRSDVNLEERNKKVTELYPQFEKSIKETMIEYGRTIKTLKDDEILMLKVKLTKCDGCGIPETLELSVSKQVLSQYDQRKLSLDKAMGAIKVKKTFKDTK